ncbi:phage major capsid protein [Desulforamulus hydrothermalis]|uniref:Phage major capsid protein n=1 Tax=Desulforamulus hydrothermalis Lam5 = DSM 18033 TaxID=1121428 RepID=K8E9L0_9FIRM|nr:phage major capsid protein [Desulforamulus hydrothermalis]CCO08268.1 Phage major capsid protein [Desulforamulus hydrothermalis Lam5 = DSM 18033]SHH37295.1 phage major capsid protein, HK97 family [Desulforamulus hydrothermalis Lam5 = DSM 18033]
MLRQLVISKKIEQRKNALAELMIQEEEIQKRSTEFEAAANEAKTDEEIAVVEEEVTKLEAQKDELEQKKSKLQGEIAELESELEQLNAKSPTGEQRSVNQQKRGEVQMAKEYHISQVRRMLETGEYYNLPEVREFYEKFKNLRAVSGGELTIPNVIINRILDIVGDYTTLYPRVEKIRVSGTARILIDTDTSAASWIEMASSIPTGDVGTITKVDFDGFKVGKVTFVDNYLLQDSIINIDDYVVRKIARAIAKALDLAILKGEGASQKQPEGIIPKIPAGNQKTVEADEKLLVNLLKNVGLIDTGDDSVGEIVAVMKRQTYYNRLLEYTINVNSEGNVVGKLPNLTQPDLCGLPVVFNQNMDVDKVLFGVLDQYTMVIREDISIDRSEHVKFVEDQMAFRGKGRFDGKPVRPAAFALVTITDPAGE